MRFESEIRKHLAEVIEAKRGRMIIFQPSYQLIISALSWCMGEGKKDSAVPGFGIPRVEAEIRERLEACRNRRDTSRLLSKNWQLIVSSLEWVLRETEISPLEARGVFG